MNCERYFDKLFFEKLRAKYLNGELTSEQNIIKEKIDLPDGYLDELPPSDSAEYQALYNLGIDAIKKDEVAAVIVNGGMATRFGNCVKGLVNVFDDKSFLQIKIENIKKICSDINAKMYVFIMNSIFTEKDTIRHFEENDYFGYDKDRIIFFNQYYFLRLTEDGEILNNDDCQVKYGCGHGDFFYAFKEFVYPDFKNTNLKYLCYSNVDNLGAYIEPAIIGYHISKNQEMTIELAEKYEYDRGGVPAVVSGRKCLIEEFKLPPTFDANKIRYFNTATYIFSFDIFKKDFELAFYLVKKNIDDVEVEQFERVAGDLSLFLSTNFLKIDRRLRFHPIKTTEDLENSRKQLKELLKNKI